MQKPQQEREYTSLNVIDFAERGVAKMLKALGSRESVLKNMDMIAIAPSYLLWCISDNF